MWLPMQMHRWLRKVNERSLPEKADFDNNLNTEDITDSDYKHVERLCKDFGMKSHGEDQR